MAANQSAEALEQHSQTLKAKFELLHKQTTQLRDQGKTKEALAKMKLMKQVKAQYEECLVSLEKAKKEEAQQALIK